MLDFINRNSALIAVCFVGQILFMQAFAQETSNSKKSLPAMRTKQPPIIDGRLDDPCWEKAPQATNFIDSFLGTPAKDQTVAKLLYDEKAIYVAIYAFDSQPEKIVARQKKDQTRFSGEDYVAFSLDPFHTHQFADRNFFVVNPLGAKFAHLAQGRAEKAEWLGLWKAQARITDDGWCVEVEIPWQMLSYPDTKKPITMSINFDRFQQRTGVHSWWSNVGVQEFYENDGHWVGVLPPAKKRELKFLLYGYFGRTYQRKIIARVGLDGRYSVTPQLTFVGTINPDFENIEQAVEGIDFSYGERFVPDRRPFFQEGRNIYSVGSLFYSRRIGDIDAGINLFGKVGVHTSVGILETFNREGNHNVFLRASRSLSATSSVGAAILGHRENALTNSVGFLEGQVRHGAFSLDAKFAQSWEEKPMGRWATLNLGYFGSRFGFQIAPFFIDPDFVNKLGFHPFTGIRGSKISGFLRNEWREGIVRSASLSLNTEVSDHYDGSIFRRAASVAGGILTHNDYAIWGGWEGGRFEEYRDSTLTISFRARSSDRFTNFGIDYSWGRRAGVKIRFLKASANLRVNALTTGIESQFLWHIEAKQQHILTFNYDFTPALSLGGRLIWRKEGHNIYFALRRSGYAGTNFYLILGDPNAEKFHHRLLGKVVWAY